MKGKESSKIWMKGYRPDKGCRNRDGSGIFYGNVCPCFCLVNEATSELITQEEFEVLNKLMEDNQ